MCSQEFHQSEQKRRKSLGILWGKKQQFGRSYNMANKIMLASKRSEMHYAVTSCNVWEKKGNKMGSVVCQFKSTFGHPGHCYILISLIIRKQIKQIS